jgi:hypothetical protein
MPLLSPEYFGTWYVITLDGKRRILQSYSETLNLESSNEKSALVGDIGKHIADIGPYHYALSLTSPILILEPYDVFYDAFDIVLENLDKIQQPITVSNISTYEYVMQSASINIATDGSNVSTQLESWQDFADAKEYRPADDFFYGRVAKFYDIYFSMFGNEYLVQSANLNIKVNNDKHFYIAGTNDFLGNQVPKYSINGYSVSGDITLLIKPDQYETLKLYNAQSPGIFNALKESVKLKVFYRPTGVNRDKTIDFGDFAFMPSIELSINPNQIITAKINFYTLFRRTSVINY